MEIAAPSSNSKSWRDAMPIHPAANIFPMMSEPELKRWGRDIKKYGLKTRIAIHDSGVDTKGPQYSLLDGRNRLAATEAVGLAPRLELKPSSPRSKTLLWTLTLEGVPEDDVPQPLYVDTDPYAFVASANIHRRHLTAKGKREAAAELIKANPEKSNRQIAEQLKVDDKTVGSTRRELERRAEIPHVETRTDSKGRQQPSAKPKRWRDRDDPYNLFKEGNRDAERKAPKKPKPHALKDEEMPTEEEAEESQQQDFYDQACHLLDLMDGTTRQRFFAEMRKLYPQEVGAATPSDDGLDIPECLRRSAP
jgi:hypothetical protein